MFDDPKIVKAKKVLKQLTPDQRGFAEAVATDRLQNKMYEKQLAELKASYDDLWKVMVVILATAPKRELRIHKTQFLKFKHEYRIDKVIEGDEVVWKLLTVFDN